MLADRRRSMQADIALKEFTSHTDVFAEIFNLFIYGGNHVVQEHRLTAIPTEAVILDEKGDLHERRRDVVKTDQRGGYYHLLFDLEHQTGIDNTMPERVMGYDYSLYEHQIKKIMEWNRERKDPAIPERIHTHQKLAPVLSIVLYWGDTEWTGPTCLHDMLEFPPEMEDQLRAVIPNYSIHVVSMATLPEVMREKMTTDLRYLAEYAACRKDPKRWMDFIQKDTGKIQHWEDCLTALSAISGERKYRDVLEPIARKVKENREEDVTMCLIYEEMTRKGREEGIQQGIQQGISALVKISKKYKQSVEDTVCEIMAEFSLPREEAEGYVKRYW